jgi:hypothetical protein
MPAVFTVQDDEGDVADANAYISVAFYDQYHTDRGRTAAVALTTDQKQIGIVRATDYVDMRWRDQFPGERLESDEAIPQSTEWPRADAAYNNGDDIEGLPIELQKAIAEYAYRAATAELLLEPAAAYDEDGNAVANGTIKEIEQVVGPVSERKVFLDSYNSFSSGTFLVDGCLIRKIPAADMLMEPLLVASTRQRRAIR